VSHYVDDAELTLLLDHDHEEREADRRALPPLLVACAIAGIAIAVIALITAVMSLAAGGDDAPAETAATPTQATMDRGTAAVAIQAAPTIAEAKGIDFEPYQRPDPTLPAVPAGAVKTFRVSVDEHVTQVSKALAPTQVWSFGVNGTSYPGTGGSPPMVVDEGDSVEITLDNKGTKGMKVAMAHSIDFHSAEVAPNVDYTDIKPGETKTFSFVAKHPGVYMYHCATAPILMHTGAGMTGMMVVRPTGLPAAKDCG